MSNKHDNIYNILGKLDALKPREAAAEPAPAKPIYESVEARGSVLSGVARVEARLAQQFSEDVRKLDEIGDTPAGRAALQKYQDKADNQVAAHWKQVHNKSYLPTDPKMAKRNAGVVAAGNRIHGFGIAKNQQDKVTDRFDYRDAVGRTHVYQKNDPLEQGVAEGSQEDAKFTPRFEVRSRIEGALDQYLDPEQVAGGYTDIQYYKHDGRVYVEVLFNYTNGQKIGPTQRKRFLVNKDFTLTPIKRQQGMAEAAAPVDYEKVLEAIAALYGDDMWDNDAMGDLAQDLEQAGPTDRELDFIIAKGKLPTRLKGIRFTNTDDVQFGHLGEESDWSNLGSEYRSTKPGTKEPTHTGEKEYFKGGVKHTRDFDREVSHKDATGEKRGRGRPKKSQFEGSIQESINFAEMMKEQHQTVDEYLMELQADIAEFKKSGHMSDKLRDSMEMHKFSKKQVTDEVRGEVKGPSFAPQFPATPAPAKPPGMLQRAGSAIAGGINKVVGHGSDAEMLNKLKHDSMDHELNELARLAGLSEGLKGGQKKLDKNKNGKLDSDDFKRLRDKVDEATVDEDMIKAKKDYDGDGEVETGSEEHAGSVDKAIKKAQAKKDLDEETHGQYLTQKEKEAQSSGKKSFQAFKQTHPVDGKPGVEEEDEVNEVTALQKFRDNPRFNQNEPAKDAHKEKVDECGMPGSMSPFSSTGQEEETGMSINSSMDTKTGRKTLSVTADGEAAEQLAQMLKMAGMGGGHEHSHEEPEAVIIQAGPEEAVEEEREDQYANTPDEEVENIDSIMHQGNDLNREKEQYSTDRGRDNPMAMHRESIEMPKSLSRMIEGIKMVEEAKCNHTDKGKKCPVHGLKECGSMYESKPSAGMSKSEKSSLVKKAKKGGDIGKPGKSFDKVAKSAGGGEKGKKIAAAAMWKNAVKK